MGLQEECSMLVFLRLFSDLKLSLYCMNRKVKKGFLFLFNLKLLQEKTKLSCLIIIYPKEIMLTFQYP